MKKQFFIVVLAFLLLGANIHLYHIKNSENQLLQFEYVSKKPKIKILLLGDSFAAYGIKNSTELGLVNFSYPGDHFGDMYFKLKSIQTFDVLILNTDPHLFNKEVGKISSKYKNKASNVSSIKKVLPILNATYRYEYGKFLVNNLVRFANTNSSDQKSIFYDSSWNLKRSNQYNWKENLNKDRELIFFKNQFKSSDEFYKNNYSYLDSIHSYCKEYGIKVIWLELPVSKEYGKMIDDIKPQIKTISDSLSKKYSLVGHLKYDSLYYSYGYHFLDPVHLNNLGSNEFNKVFIEDLKIAIQN